MANKFKINDLVEVMNWDDNIRKDWIIIGFASSGSEALIFHLFRKERSFVMLSNLKLQKKD